MTTDDVARLLVGETQIMQELRDVIVRVAPSTLPILIEGPTGAGKELVAQALHLASGRRGAFLPVNVCALPDSLIEDALFGHARGAFTGAVSDHIGFLKEADGGTLFLDEIGSLPRPPQVKLLRAIETGQFRPNGARSDVRSTFRLVTASNEPIADLVRRGKFREDLAQRLHGYRIAVPSLKQRRDDIPLLAEHFASSIAGTPPAAMWFDAEAIDALRSAAWRGNVRQLKHVVEAALLFAKRQTITADVLREAAALEVAARPGNRAEREVSLAIEDGRALLLTALRRHGWDVERAAAEFRVNRATIYRWMRRFGVKSPPRQLRSVSAPSSA